MSAIPLTRPYRLHLSSGAIEAAKWAALVCMLVDHVNAVVFGREWGMLADALGRIALPLFAVVFGYNLARPGVIRPALQRLALAGVVALPFHAYLFADSSGWWPLNILLAFAVAALVVHLWTAGAQAAAVGAFVLGGALVEYWWPGLVLVLATFAAARHGLTAGNVAAFGLGFGGLLAINGNGWALLALPLLAVLHLWSPAVPRSGRFFLWFYPSHLAVLAFISVVMM